MIDDQAKAILNPMNLTAAAEGGEETQTPETASSRDSSGGNAGARDKPGNDSTGNSSTGNTGARDGSTGNTGSRDSGTGNKSIGNDSARTIICRGCSRTGSGSRKF